MINLSKYPELQAWWRDIVTSELARTQTIINPTNCFGSVTVTPTVEQAVAKADAAIQAFLDLVAALPPKHSCDGSQMPASLEGN